MLSAFLLFFALKAPAQCPAPIAQGTCSGGAGAATNGVNINSGQTYWFTGGPTTFASGVNLNGGTLRVCGNLTLSSINFNSGTIIVTSGGSLTINGGGDMFLNGNCSIYNFGTLSINRPVTMQNSNNLIMNASTAAAFHMIGGSWELEINSSSSFFINYGLANIHTLFVQSTASAGAVCLGLNSALNLTMLNNNVASGINAPSGQACLRYTGNAILNANLSGTSNVRVCRAAGSTTSGGFSFGSATVTTNCASCSVALPVRLREFQAGRTGGGVRLRWETEGERNNSHFEVERSEGGPWTSIGRVNGAGNATAAISYQFIDPTPIAGNNYYRLRQVDLDGSATYSPVVLLAVSSLPQNSMVYPNPNRGSSIQLRGIDPAGAWDLDVVDLQGRTLCRVPVRSQNLMLPQLQPGSYILRFRHAATGASRYEKYLVQ